MSNVPNQGPPDWLKKADRNPQPLLLVLSGIVVALCVTCIILRVGFDRPVVPEVFGSLIFAGITLACVLAYWYSDRSTVPEGESARLLALGVGGALGLGLALATLARIYVWWEYLSGGLEAWQGNEGWRLWLLTGTGVASCLILFGSLLLARTEEQSHAHLRRLLYGYNAVLTVFLLCLILGLVNMLIYNYVPTIADYTQNKIYTLNPKSQEILKGIRKPVTVIALVDSLTSNRTKELKDLDENMRRVTDKIRFEYVVRDRNPILVRQLVDKYKIVSDYGLLVIYGDPDDPNPSTQFIKFTELSSARGGPESDDFKGEDLLMTAIDFLDQNKTKPVVYFTQGNGELDIGFSSENLEENRRASELRQRLENANYEVKGLRLSTVKEDKANVGGLVTQVDVPDDATVVVIAGPTRRFSEDAVKALDAYLKRNDPKKTKGKLFVLLDVDVVKPDGVMRQTGLEKFLESFSVEPHNDRILTNNKRFPQRVITTGNPALRSSNPVAAALTGVIAPMSNVRTIHPHPGAPPMPGGAMYRPEILMVAIPDPDAGGSLIWPETDLSREPEAILEELVKDPKKINTKQVTEGALPMAVAVTEMGPTMTPRLLVFGNAAFVSDASLKDHFGFGTGGHPNYDIFESSLAWVRERPQSIGLASKERKIYQIEPNTNFTRMFFLPLGLMTVAILGLGLGVWVVRRR
jgi:hypothetical protein